MTETTQFPRYPYLAMLITGVMHVVLGAIDFVAALIIIQNDVSFESDPNIEYNYLYFSQSIFYIAPVCSTLVISVGVFGIVAGLKSPATHVRKLAYMIMSILSAALISMTGMSIFIIAGLYFIIISATDESFDSKQNSLYIGSFLGAAVMFTEFILAIVSSSICCCCAKTHSLSAGIIINQQPQVQVHTTETSKVSDYPLQPYDPPTQTANSPQYPEYPRYPQGMGYQTLAEN